MALERMEGVEFLYPPHVAAVLVNKLELQLFLWMSTGANA